MAKTVKCENKDCKLKTEIEVNITLFEGEKIYCGGCGAVLPVKEK